MKTIEFYIIWGISFLIGLLSDFNQNVVFFGVVIIVARMLWLKRGLEKQLTKDIDSGDLIYFEVKNSQRARVKDIFQTPVLLIALCITLLTSEEYKEVDLFALFIVMPIIPFIVMWLVKLIFSSYSSGLIISDSYIQNGFEGEKIKWVKIVVVVIGEDWIQIKTKGERIKKKLSAENIYLLQKVLVKNEVAIEN